MSKANYKICSSITVWQDINWSKTVFINLPTCTLYYVFGYVTSGKGLCAIPLSLVVKTMNSDESVIILCAVCGFCTYWLLLVIWDDVYICLHIPKYFAFFPLYFL